MADSKNRITGNTFEKILASGDPSQPIKTETKETSSIRKDELELAATVILVDIACSDGHFDPPEYEVISDGLRRLFGTTKDRVKSLVNQSQQILGGLRGTSAYIAKIRDNMSESDREAVFAVVEDLSAADGEEDPFEIYLKNKLKAALGLKTE